MAWHIAFIFNFASVALVYGGSYALLYGQNARAALSQHKFNPQYPSDALVSLEIRRTLISVLVCCLYEVGITSFCLPPPPHANTVTTAAAAAAAVCTAVGLLLWSDAHFYFVHRLLHEVPALYRHVHKVHHESHNPDPWSGLSFHPVEAALYFSSLCIACVLPVPHWAFWVHKTALLIAPANGHHGHDVVVMPQLFGSEHHYLHHAHFDCNYGSPTPFWDWALGTQRRRAGTRACGTAAKKGD